MARLSVQKLQYGARARRVAPVRYSVIGSYGAKAPKAANLLRAPFIAKSVGFSQAVMNRMLISSMALTQFSPWSINAKAHSKLITYNRSSEWRYGHPYAGNYHHHWEPTDRSALVGTIQFRYESLAWRGGGAGDWLEWYIPNPDSGNALWPGLVKCEYHPGTGSNPVAQPTTVSVQPLPLGNIVLDPFDSPLDDPSLRPFSPIRYSPLPAVAPAPAPDNAVILKLGGNNAPRFRTTRHNNIARPRRGDRERKLVGGGKAYRQLTRWIGRATESLDFVGCVAKASGTYGGPGAYLRYVAKGNVPEMDIDKFVKCMVKNAVEDALIGGVNVYYRKQRRMRHYNLGVDDLPGVKGPAFGTSGGPAPGVRISF